MSALRDLIQGEAELGSGSEDESFDEETGEVRVKRNGVNGVNGHLDDSSEEDDDDDDEEAARAVCVAVLQSSAILIADVGVLLNLG